MFKMPLEPEPPHEVAPSHPLASAWAKYNRALEHQQRVIPIAKELINGQADTLPARFSCMVGDVIHNARVALDHAMWALAIAHSPNPAARKVYFPISDAPKDFDRSRSELAEMVGVKAVSLLESLQPYEDRPGLCWLRDLDNVDKHVTVLEMRPARIIDGIFVNGVEGAHIVGSYPGPPTEPQDIRVVVSVTLKLNAVRSAPEARLDLMLRQIVFDTEQCLLDIEQFFD